jgi:DNA-binding response OmpR family regulator
VIDLRTALLVDDNPAILSGLSGLMESAGLRVVGFGDFQSAHDYLQGHIPDVLVTDVRLGAYNGLHLVVLARKLAPTLPLIVYSAHDDPELRREAESFGAVYLGKDHLLTELLPCLLGITSGGAGADDNLGSGEATFGEQCDTDGLAPNRSTRVPD